MSLYFHAILQLHNLLVDCARELLDCARETLELYCSVVTK